MTLGLGAAACALAFVVLGACVGRRDPGAFDRAAFALRGRGVMPAYLFTLLGRAPALTILAVLGVGIAMTLRSGLADVATLLATQGASQLTSSACKRLYDRPRPAEYVGVRERERSYPSGHAATATVFFGGFALLVARAALPVPIATALAIVLITCAIAIPWSRLALGAHYPSDLAGGVLLGGAWGCAVLALTAPGGVLR